MSIGPEENELAAVLIGAHRQGVLSVWHRLERAHELSAGLGVLTGGWAVYEGTAPPMEVGARARDGAARSIGRPPGDRLWAG
jgi:hypothetical protein